MTRRASGSALRALCVLSVCVAVPFGAACTKDEPPPEPVAEDEFRPDPQPESGDFVLSVVPAQAKVPLGGEIELRVRVENRGEVKADLNVPRLGRDSVSFRIRTERGDVLWLNPMPCRETDEGPRPDPPEVRAVGKGESVEGTIRFAAVMTGRLTFGATYVCQALASQPLVTEPVAVEVTPTDSGSHLGLRLETTQGTIEAQFRPEYAFQTVTAIATLVQRGFYDGLTFHRVIRGFMAQGGDPKGTGTGGPGFMLPRELHGKLAHRRGVFSMARKEFPPDSAGSQFFIMFRDDPNLDAAGYTTFAEMTSGKDALQRIEALGSDGGPGASEGPKEPISIRKATLFVMP